MKNFYFILLLSFSTTNSSAQLEKGTKLVGGSGTFYSYTENYSNNQSYSQTAKYTNIDLNVTMGYFIIDKLVVGLKPSYSSFKGEVVSSNAGSGGKTNSYKIAVGPFTRYYFLKNEKPLNVLAEASYQMGINKFLGVLKEKGRSNTFSFLVGPEIFFNDTAGLEFLFGYTNKLVTIDNSAGAFENKKSGLQISIGITLHLDKL